MAERKLATLIPMRPLRSPESALVDDMELVVRSSEGAHWARSELFKRYAPSILSMLTHLLASTVDAEDATQDTFVEALRGLPKLRDPSLFGAWLRQIAVRQANRRFRKRKLLALLGLQGQSLDATLDQLADQSQNTEERAELANIQRILDGLPAAVRTAWALRRVEGFALSEIAVALGISLATVKRKLVLADKAIELGRGQVEDRAQ